MKFSVQSQLLIVLATLTLLAVASPTKEATTARRRSVAHIIHNNKKSLEIEYELPTKTYHYFSKMKRDVVDLHNTGGKTTTTTTTRTPTSTATHKPSPTTAPSSDPEDIYGGKGITPQNGVAGAFLIVLGLYLMIFGFRSFRITLAVCGFLTFALITWVAMANNQPYYGYINNNITMIAVPAGLGILGAIIYAIFWNISIYLIGAMSGFTLALYIMCCKENLLITPVVARAAFLVALPFFMSLITFFVERYVLLFTFAFVGSYCFVVGIEFLAHTGYLAGIKSILDGNAYHRVVYVISRNVIIVIAFIPIIFLISFAWQYLYNRGQKFGVIFVVPPSQPEKGKKGGGQEKPPFAAGDPGPVDKHEPHIEVDTHVKVDGHEV
ncbi:hypothetical protein BDF20DRAFT_873353 [Mycotypha africana]|uniref:uncharacterized protein n=1 Tax=Mycotypha africana TaxID=64632 RepID=UPI002300518C|nr:uncharacterized protein BDF20DRAFT_873353 [Mycotypha africana]KAI8977170.1 hypothetical protein BDF20DRAFT_873353 [Mycotypha africana]